MNRMKERILRTCFNFLVKGKMIRDSFFFFLWWEAPQNFLGTEICIGLVLISRYSGGEEKGQEISFSCLIHLINFYR